LHYNSPQQYGEGIGECGFGDSGEAGGGLYAVQFRFERRGFAEGTEEDIAGSGGMHHFRGLFGVGLYGGEICMFGDAGSERSQFAHAVVFFHQAGANGIGGIDGDGDGGREKRDFNQIVNRLFN